MDCLSINAWSDGKNIKEIIQLNWAYSDFTSILIPPQATVTTEQMVNVAMNISAI